MTAMVNRNPLACPHCGPGDFEILGVVEYSKPYSAQRNEYGQPRFNWDFEFPTYAECAGCKKPVTEYLQESGVLGACTTFAKENESGHRARCDGGDHVESEMESVEEVMRRYPRITAHVICHSLGYATSICAARIVRDAKYRQKNACEWLYSCYNCDPVWQCGRRSAGGIRTGVL